MKMRGLLLLALLAAFVAVAVTRSTDDDVAPTNPECKTAYDGLTAFMKEGVCAGHLNNILVTSLESKDVNLTEEVKQYCTGADKCQTTLATRIRAFVDNCEDKKDLNRDVLRKALFVSNFACVVEGPVVAPAEEKFCAVDFINAVKSDIKFGNITQEYIENTCTPCVVKALQAFEFRDKKTGDKFQDSTKKLRALCSQVDGEWCAVKYKLVLNRIRTGKNQGLVKEILENVCGSCLRVFIARLKNIQDDDVSRREVALSSKYTKYCKKDKKDYCLVKVFDVEKFLEDENPCADIENECSDDCKKLVKKVVDKAECCWSVLLDKIDVDNTEEARKRAKIAIEKCGVSLPKSCTVAQRKKIVAFFNNFKKQWVEENRKEIIEAIKEDITLTYGDLVFDDIDVVVLSNGKVKVTVELESGADDDSKVFDSKYQCVNMCNMDVDSREDPTTRTTSDVMVESVDSSASSIAFSAAIAFTALFALLF